MTNLDKLQFTTENDRREEDVQDNEKTSQELGNCPMGQREALLKETFY